MKNRLVFGVITFLVLLVTFYVLVQYLMLPKEYVGFLYWKAEALKVKIWYPMLYTHIVFGTIALLFLPFQINGKLLHKKPTVHRRLGKISVMSIVVSALSGLFIGFHAEGGFIGKLGFITLAILWLVTTFIALANIKKRNITAHRQWMLRSGALTCAAITLRLLLPLFLYGLGMEYAEAAKYIAWLAWLPNLILVEMYFYIEKLKQKSTSIEF